MSVPGISLVTVLLTSVVPAIGTAQMRGAVTASRSARGGGTSNRFEAGRLTGTTVRPAPPVERRLDHTRIREPGYFPGYYPRLYRAGLASYERALARAYTAADASVAYDERGPANGWPAWADSRAPAPAPEPVDTGTEAHLEWRPGGIFPAGAEPAHIVTATGTPSTMPGVFESVVPAATPAEARLDVVAPVIGWTEVRCLEPMQERQSPRRVPRVLGWLYRWARGFDIEKSSASPPLLYLRSPLLSGFQERTGCGHEDTGTPDRNGDTCFAVTASNGLDHVVTYLVHLPQMGARTTRELTSALRQRLDEGETVPLKTIGGGVVELTPDRAVTLDVRACEVRTE